MINFNKKRTQRIISSIIILLLAAALVLTSIAVYADDEVADAAAEESADAAADESADAADEDSNSSEDGSADTVTDGVFVGDINISGMTYDEANDAVKTLVKERKSVGVTIDIDGEAVTTTIGDLGYKWSNREIIEEAVSLGKTGNVIKRYKDTLDLANEDKVYEVEMSITSDDVCDALDEICSPYNVEAVNATLTRSGGSFVITDEVDGLSIDIETTAAEIYDYITTQWDGDSDLSFTATTQVETADVTAEDCALVGSTPMGTYTTYFSTSYTNRCLNIKNGAEHLDGSVIYPGEQYSVNEHLEERNAENGYYLAGTYVDGTTQDSYGGGICQVSSTLYNALLLAEIEIVERSPHSMTVSYVPLSQDAAIAGNYKDLVFENNTEAPIYIEAIYGSGYITFNVYGYDTRDSGRTIKYVSETTSTTEPGEDITESDEYPEGYEEIVSTGHTGYTARLWKYVYQDGELVSEEIVNTSTYSATDTEIIVGTGESEDEDDEDSDDEDDEDSDDDEEETTKKKSSDSDDDEEETTTKKKKSSDSDD